MLKYSKEMAAACARLQMITFGLDQELVITRERRESQVVSIDLYRFINAEEVLLAK